jgi:hypothetical protein
MKAILSSLLLTFLPLSIIEKDNSTKLSLSEEKYVTDRSGVANPNIIIRLVPSNNIKMYLIDGTELIGLVTSVEEVQGESFKVYGEIQNKKNSGFGFLMKKTGEFAGAILMKDENLTYVLNYSEESKGYIFIKTLNVNTIALK